MLGQKSRPRAVFAFANSGMTRVSEHAHPARHGEPRQRWCRDVLDRHDGEPAAGGRRADRRHPARLDPPRRGWRRPACGWPPRCSMPGSASSRRRRLAALLEAFKPDLVHCWMRRAASLVPRLDVPVIGWFGGYYEPANFARCSHFVGVTPGHRRAHGRARRGARSRATYVPTFPTIEAAAPVDRAALATLGRGHRAAHPVAAARQEGARHPARGARPSCRGAWPGSPATARWRAS